LFPFSHAPVWPSCHGQVLNIVGNEILFELLGTVFGGNAHGDLRAARPACPFPGDDRVADR
jgi:microcystin-dependent protein